MIDCQRPDRSFIVRVKGKTLFSSQRDGSELCQLPDSFKDGNRGDETVSVSVTFFAFVPSLQSAGFRSVTYRTTP